MGKAKKFSVSIGEEMRKRLSKKGIVETYKMICDYYEKFLKVYGVKLPRLQSKRGFTRNALALVYLARNYPNTAKVTKGELTEFIRSFYPETNDVQQGRHLAMQNGWYIESGTRGNSSLSLSKGEYQLVSLEKAYPGFIPETRDVEDWEKIKELFDYRCATCGSKEGEFNIHYKKTITRLQKGHIDPNRPLVVGNIIPQCEKCNRPDRNNWVYDKRGRVIKLANPKVIMRSDKKVRWEIYRILYEKFGGVNPNE